MKNLYLFVLIFIISNYFIGSVFGQRKTFFELKKAEDRYVLLEEWSNPLKSQGHITNGYPVSNILLLDEFFIPFFGKPNCELTMKEIRKIHDTYEQLSIDYNASVYHLPEQVIHKIANPWGMSGLRKYSQKGSPRRTPYSESCINGSQNLIKMREPYIRLINDVKADATLSRTDIRLLYDIRRDSRMPESAKARKYLFPYEFQELSDLANRAIWVDGLRKDVAEIENYYKSILDKVKYAKITWLEIERFDKKHDLGELKEKLQGEIVRILNKHKVSLEQKYQHIPNQECDNQSCRVIYGFYKETLDEYINLSQWRSDNKHFRLRTGSDAFNAALQYEGILFPQNDTLMLARVLIDLMQARTGEKHKAQSILEEKLLEKQVSEEIISNTDLLLKITEQNKKCANEIQAYDDRALLVNYSNYFVQLLNTEQKEHSAYVNLSTILEQYTENKTLFEDLLQKYDYYGALADKQLNKPCYHPKAGKCRVCLDYMPQTCGACGGKGTVLAEKRRFDPYGDFVPKPVTCPRCSGAKIVACDCCGRTHNH